MMVMKEKSWIGVGDGGHVVRKPRLEQSVSLPAPGVGMLENVESEVLARNGCVIMGKLCLTRFCGVHLGVGGV